MTTSSVPQWVQDKFDEWLADIDTPANGNRYYITVSNTCETWYGEIDADKYDNWYRGYSCPSDEPDPPTWRDLDVLFKFDKHGQVL